MDLVQVLGNDCGCRPVAVTARQGSKGALTKAPTICRHRSQDLESRFGTENPGLRKIKQRLLYSRIKVSGGGTGGFEQYLAALFARITIKLVDGRKNASRCWIASLRQLTTPGNPRLQCLSRTVRGLTFSFLRSRA